MINSKYILEAVNRGIKFALDDFDDNELIGQQTQTIKDQNITKDYLTLMEYVVDLDLPSGTLWCKYNLGCNYNLLNNNINQTKPKDWYGDYYAWGEIEPKKLKYDWDSYKFGNQSSISKYNEDDNLTQLQLEDDAAYQNLHIRNYKFHIPTKEQFDELLKYTTQTWSPNYNNIVGLNGLLIIGKNGNTIFMPATWGLDEQNKKVDTALFYGKYWSSTHLNSYRYYHAYFLKFYKDKFYKDQGCSISDNQRSNGFAIRPVINLN